MTRRRDARIGACTVVALASIAAACAVQRSEPKSAPPARQQPTVQESEGGAGASDAAKDEDETPSTAAPVPPPPPAPVVPGAEGGATGTIVTADALAQAQVAFDDASKAFAAAGSDCASLCKALTSMTNATARLCSLTESGAPDQQKRCTDARAKLDDAQAKVKSSCGAC